MTARLFLGVVAVVGLLVGLMVAVVIGGPGGHLATAIEWMIQVLILVCVLFLLASRIRRRS